MEWTDSGIVLFARLLNENSMIVHLLTQDHGVHHGLVRGTKKHAALCQPGNFVAVRWNARLEEQLGFYQLETKRNYSALILDDALKLAALTSLCALMNKTLPERAPYEHLFEQCHDFIHMLVDASVGVYLPYYIKLEIALLCELGYGLDLSTCAAGGGKKDLAYVSPRTGRAVSVRHGEPYADKLLCLPEFLKPDAVQNNCSILLEIIDGIKLTDYFLSRHVFEGKPSIMPAARQRFVHKVKQLARQAHDYNT